MASRKLSTEQKERVDIITALLDNFYQEYNFRVGGIKEILDVLGGMEFREVDNNEESKETRFIISKLREMDNLCSMYNRYQTELHEIYKNPLGVAESEDE